MPFCHGCGAFFDVDKVPESKICPVCGKEIGARPDSLTKTAEGASDGDHAAPTGIPWHFWLLLVAAVVYLAWRAIQGVGLLF